MILQFINKPYLSNTYIVDNPEDNQVIVIDPGTKDCDNIIDFIHKQGKEISYIILTHEHFDHIAGVNKLREFSSSKLICSEACGNAIQHPETNMSKYYEPFTVNSAPPDMTYEKLNFRLDWGGFDFKFYLTPGHSPGSACIGSSNFLFSGDTILKNHRTVSHFPGGDKTKLKESLNFLINGFSPETLIYPGHGEPFYLSDYKYRNLYLIKSMNNINYAAKS